MSKIVYVFGCTTKDIDSWLSAYGFDSIYCEEVAHEETRPLLKDVVSILKAEDELIIGSLCHTVRSMTQLGILFELCRIKKVRLISITDKIDTKNEIFDETASGIITAISSFPTNRLEFRKKVGEPMISYMPASYTRQQNKKERDKRVIELYLAGYSNLHIFKAMGIGHTVLYSILKRNGIPCRRMKVKDG